MSNDCDTQDNLMHLLAARLQAVYPQAQIAYRSMTGEHVMYKNERDTHYANAAKLLTQKLQQDGLLECWNPDFGEVDQEKVQQATQVITSFLFDFADHMIKHLHGSNLEEIRREGLARYLEQRSEEMKNERVPDMTAWPE